MLPRISCLGRNFLVCNTGSTGISSSVSKSGNFASINTVVSAGRGVGSHAGARARASAMRPHPPPQLAQGGVLQPQQNAMLCLRPHAIANARALAATPRAAAVAAAMAAALPPHAAGPMRRDAATAATPLPLLSLARRLPNHLRPHHLDAGYRWACSRAAPAGDAGGLPSAATVPSGGQAGEEDEESGSSHGSSPGSLSSSAEALEALLPSKDDDRASAAAAAAAEPRPQATPQPTAWQKLADGIVTNFLPIALSTGLGLGVLMPEVGAAAAQTSLQTYIVIAIFITSGLQIKRGEALQALSSTGSVGYGLLSILFLSPLLLSPIALLAPLQPQSLALGLAVFFAMPTALSSGITMTQTMGGNVAMAILLTVTSNMLAVFTVPYMLPHLLGSAASGFSLDSMALLKQLVMMVMLPTMLGAVLRGSVARIGDAVDANKRFLSCFSAACLAAVPWMQVSRAMLQDTTGLSVASVAASAGLGVALHLSLLVLNIGAVRALNLGRNAGSAVEQLKIQQAVVLLASQKTLPVAVTVLTQLSVSMGSAVGLGAMSVVFSHLSQIVVDSFLVAWWIKRYGRIGERGDPFSATTPTLSAVPHAPSKPA